MRLLLIGYTTIDSRTRIAARGRGGGSLLSARFLSAFKTRLTLMDTTSMSHTLHKQEK